jgi:lipoprotein-anchoring transpeptidase ErfK/SrfK
MWIFVSLMLLGSQAGAQTASTPKATRDADFQNVLRLQVLLDRAHFSPGEIDGKPGSNLKAAAEAFKRERMGGPDVTDAALVESLAAADTAPIVTEYTITLDDVKGPFVAIPTDMMKQARLKALGYSSALEGIAEKFHASPTLLQRINPKKRFVAGAVIQVPSVARTPVTKVARILVSKTQQSVTAVDETGAILAYYPATLGSERDPLPIGDWKINGVSRNPPFHYNPDLFWDSKPQHSKATLPPGPNSPVGVVWIDLSKENMGIHGTAEPSAIGKRQSHGCIRLTNWDASELADLVKPGMPAILLEN